MTNGEKIKVLLKPREYEIKTYGDWVEIEIQRLGINFSCSLEWWNAEYKEPTIKNNLVVDCISRADARKAIIDHQYSDSFCEEHNIDHSINTSMALIALSDLPSVTPQEPRKDEVILTKEEYGELVSSEFDNGYAKGYREALEQEPRKGHWIDDKCSVCGKGIEDLIDSQEWYRNEEPNFCPFCGAKMVEPQESEDKE